MTLLSHKCAYVNSLESDLWQNCKCFENQTTILSLCSAMFLLFFSFFFSLTKMASFIPLSNHLSSSVLRIALVQADRIDKDRIDNLRFGPKNNSYTKLGICQKLSKIFLIYSCCRLWPSQPPYRLVQLDLKSSAGMHFSGVKTFQSESSVKVCLD